jgi:hypothetical protein
MVLKAKQNGDDLLAQVKALAALLRHALVIQRDNDPTGALEQIWDVLSDGLRDYQSGQALPALVAQLVQGQERQTALLEQLAAAFDRVAERLDRLAGVQPGNGATPPAQRRNLLESWTRRVPGRVGR